MIEKKLEGKVALITGAAQGIGKAIAERFVCEGASVIIADLLHEKAEKVAKELSKNQRTLAVKTDVSLSRDVENLFSIVRREFGRLDILVNNAGILIKGPFLDITEEIWDKTMAVNLKGPFLCSKSAAELMKGTGGGRIINITSIDGAVVYHHGHHVPYGVSKAGLIMLTKIMAVELAHFNINVNAIAPGVVAGDRIRRVIEAKAQAQGVSFKEKEAELLRDASLRCYVTAQDITNMALYLCSPFGATISGQALAVDGDLQRLG